MLVLSRKVGERILIGDQVAVTIVRVTGGGVRLGIEAPSEMAVLRAEIVEGQSEGDQPGAKEVIKTPAAMAESSKDPAARNRHSSSAAEKASQPHARMDGKPLRKAR